MNLATILRVLDPPGSNRFLTGIPFSRTSGAAPFSNIAFPLIFVYIESRCVPPGGKVGGKEPEEEECHFMHIQSRRDDSTRAIHRRDLETR